MITEQQKIDRRQGIGGSDIAIILGLSNYKTPYQLYLEKKGLIESTFEQTQLQYWGSQLEVAIRKEFRKRNKVKVETPKETIIHPFYDFLRGNVDGYIPKWNAIWEGKCSHQFMSQLWGEHNSDVIPMEYLVQVAFYCSVKNAQQANISVLIGGNDYREFVYKRDLELEKTIIDAACSFWDAVQNDTPPSAVNQIDLKLMFPSHSPDKMKTIDASIKEHLNTFGEMKSKIKELESIQETAKFNITKYMEDAECLLDEQGEPLCTWRANKRGSRTFLLKGATND
jgi:putative phage-type endonuclease